MFTLIKRLVCPEGKYSYLNLKSTAGETKKEFDIRTDVLWRRYKQKASLPIMTIEEYESIPERPVVHIHPPVGDRFIVQPADDIGVFGVQIRIHDPEYPNMKWNLEIYRLDEPIVYNSSTPITSWDTELVWEI